MERFVAGSLISAELPVNLPEVDLPSDAVAKSQAAGRRSFVPNAAWEVLKSTPP
jgi:hypothetical protein